jgi:excisionase family DNA binding protein
MTERDEKSIAGADRLPMRLLLRPAEVAVALGISRSRCYELLAAGELPCLRIGSAVRVPVADLERWIVGRTTTPKNQ